MTKPSLTIFAPAKINLYLHVTGKLANGYHTLDSLVSFADIGDEITIAPADDFIFEINGPYARYFTQDALKSDEASSNLVVKAAFALSQKLEKPPHFKITLTKNLPLASGIGGGSSNAAATLWGLMEWWDVKDKNIDLADLFLTLGADVPICYFSQPARMQGIGDIITPIPRLPEMHVVLINAGTPCPTQSVFTRHAQPFSENITIPENLSSPENLIEFLSKQRNDLTAAASDLVAEINHIIPALQKTKGCMLSRLSGSGATVFGLFDNPESARSAASTLKQENQDWWIKTGTLNQIERY